MKKLIIFCSLMFASMAIAKMPSPIQDLQVEVTEEKRAQQQYSYNFGTVPLSTRAVHHIRINNTGSVPLYFQGSNVYGQGFEAFHSCAGVLFPRSACMVSLEFAPFWEGYHNGQFAIYFDQAQVFINLSGFASRW